MYRSQRSPTTFPHEKQRTGMIILREGPELRDRAMYERNAATVVVLANESE